MQATRSSVAPAVKSRIISTVCNFLRSLGDDLSILRCSPVVLSNVFATNYFAVGLPNLGIIPVPIFLIQFPGI